MFCVVFLMYSFILYTGSRLIRDANLTVENLFKSMFALIFSVSGFGGLAFVMPNI